MTNTRVFIVTTILAVAPMIALVATCVYVVLNSPVHRVLGY